MQILIISSTFNSFMLQFVVYLYKVTKLEIEH